MKTLLLSCLLVLLALPGWAGSSKPQATVRFYPEGSEADTETFANPVQVPGFSRTIFVKNIPTIHEKDIVGLKTFQANDGTYGVMFMLSPHGKMTLELETGANVGKAMVCIFNGAPIAALYIDRRITDGVIGIPSGLQFRDIELLEEVFGEKDK